MTSILIRVFRGEKSLFHLWTQKFDLGDGLWSFGFLLCTHPYPYVYQSFTDDILFFGLYEDERWWGLLRSTTSGYACLASIGEFQDTISMCL